MNISINNSLNNNHNNNNNNNNSENTNNKALLLNSIILQKIIKFTLEYRQPKIQVELINKILNSKLFTDLIHNGNERKNKSYYRTTSILNIWCSYTVVYVYIERMVKEEAVCRTIQAVIIGTFVFIDETGLLSDTAGFRTDTATDKNTTFVFAEDQAGRITPDTAPVLSYQGLVARVAQTSFASVMAVDQSAVSRLLGGSSPDLRSDAEISDRLVSARRALELLFCLTHIPGFLGPNGDGEGTHQPYPPLSSVTFTFYIF